MAELEQLKQKYASVLELIQRRNVRLDHLHVQDDKLVMRGAAPNEEIKNEVWNAIKAIDPGYSDLSADISVDSGLPAPAAEAKRYTVKPATLFPRSRNSFTGTRISTCASSKQTRINWMIRTMSKPDRN